MVKRLRTLERAVPQDRRNLGVTPAAAANRNHRNLRGFWGLLPALLLSAVSTPLLAAGPATQFAFLPSSSPAAGVTYYLSGAHGVTFNVQAEDSTGALANSFNGAVTAILIDTSTGNPSDPKAIFVNSGGTTVWGQIPLTFVNGVLNFGVTFEAGSNSEAVSLYSTTISTGDLYPTSGGFVVQGFGQSYFLQPYNVSTYPTTTQAYVPTPSPTPATDLLVNNFTALELGANFGLTLPQASGTTGSSGIDTGAAAFAIQNISGGYAFGGQGITVNLWLSSPNNQPTTINYQVILDYNGGLTDYNNPTPSDTVYQGAVSTASSIYRLFSVTPTLVPGFPDFQPFMTNGQIILRIWTPSGPATGGMRYLSSVYSANDFCYANVPYSGNNVLPLKATLSPSTVLSGSTPSLQYVMLNQFSNPVSYVQVQVPEIGGNFWTVNTESSSTGSVAVVTQATSSAPGILSLTMPAGLPNNASVTLTLGVTAPATTFSGWPFAILTALTTTGTGVLTDSSQANINTLGVPDTPGSFTGVPANFNSGGGAVSLSWSQSVSQNPLGYVISRNPGATSGNAFGNPVTLPSGTIVNNAVTVVPAGTTSYLDSGVTNLTGYAYTIQAFNTITQSGSAGAGPVTAFANPNPPGPVTALTGGTTIQLSWAAPASAVGSFAVTGYQIYRGTSSGGENTTPIAAVTSSAAAVTYNDIPPVSPGTTYYYYLSSIDTQYSGGPTFGAHDSGPSAEVTGFPPGNPPNNVGVTLAVIGPPATLAVTWTAPVSDLNSITNYYIWKETDSGGFGASAFATVGGAAVSVWDGAVTTGHTYSYFVQAVDSFNNVSNDSTTVTGQVGPSPPTGLAAVGYTNSVTLTWNSNPSNQNVVNYVIESNGTPLTVVPAPGAGGPVTGFDTTPVQGTNYGYQVAGINNNGVTGTFCAAVTSSLLPLIPQSFGVTVQQTGVSFNMDLNWTAPLSGGNVTAYNARYNTVNSFPGTFIGSLPFAPQPYVFSEPVSAAGATIFFWIRAVDPGGVGPTTEVGLQVPPNPPVIQPATSTAATITVNWTDRPVTENVSLYTVYRSTNPTSGFTSIGTSSAALSSYNDGTGVAGTDYYYEVTATDPGGGAGIPGGESLPSGTVESALAPAVPVGLTAVLNPASDNVTLTWTSQSGSEANLQSYTLYRTINGGAPATLQTAADTVVTYADTGITSLNAGTTVFYYLYATNNAGANSQPETVGLQVPPNPPAILPASPSSTAVTINWTAIVGQGVSQYTIYRAVYPPVSFAAVGTATPGTANSYTDLGPAEGVTYVYYLTATNLGGGPGVPGGTSLPSASVTTGLGALMPTGLAVTGISAANNISVTWTNVTTADPNATGVSLLVNTTNSTAGASQVSLVPTAVSYVDQGVFTGSVTGEAPDTTYYYWLEALNTFGPSTPEGPVFQLTYPGAVNLVSATIDPDGVSRDLTWTPVGSGDVASYNIYREQIGGSGYVSVGSVPAAGLTFPVKRSNEILPGKLYAYEITAVNATGEGGSQNAVTVGVPPDDPSSVTALSGITNTAAVSLTWAEPNGASEGVTGYTLYRGTSPTWPAPTTVVIPGLAVTTYLDNTGLTAGTSYYYWVEADSNDGAESLPTTAASSVTVAAAVQPNPPTALAETDGNASVSLTWTAAISTTFPITGYNLYNSPNGGATVKANATPVAGSPATLLGLSNGTTYSLWAQAVDSHGNLSPFSNAVTGLPAAPPGVPGNFAGYSGNNSDEAYWKTSAAGSLPVSYYVVERIALTGSVTTFAQVPSNQTGYVDGSASNGSTYVYSVEAVDNSGVTTGSHASGFSNSVTVVTGQIAINPPSQVSAQGGVNQVALKWTDSLGSSSPVTGYQIYRATSASGPFSMLPGAPVTTTEPNAYTDATAVNGTTYYYYFISLASGTTAVSADSATVLGTPAPPPAAPTPVINTDGSASVTLDWTASPNEGAVTMAQYVINRAILPAASAALTATSGSVTDYLDNSGLSNGETVVYQVEAVNSNGTTGALSAAVTGYPYASFPPTGFASTDSATAVTLSWTAPVGTTWPVTGYDLVRTPLSGGSPVTLAAAGPPYTDSTGTLGEAYLYTLTATDSKGHVSTVDGPVTDGPANPPAAPTTVVATAGDQQVLFDWPASAPVSGSLPVSFYLLSLNGSAPITLPASQTWYLDSGLVNPAGVTAVVQALDETDNPTGNHLSLTVTGGPVTTAITDLNPPTALAATALGPNSVKLTWARPNDEGNIVTGYDIYRAGSFTTVLGTPIATLANPPLAPVTVYNDANVSPNSTYFYVMTAIYQQGASQVASPPSNHASVTTPAPGNAVPPVTVGQMAFDANLVKPLNGQVLGIYFVAPDSGPAQINVYNISGNPIRALYAISTAGMQENLTWDCKDRNGNLVASGLYLLEIKAPGLHQIKKVLVVK
jgi:fibronectin type 3 domain-containing protein